MYNINKIATYLSYFGKLEIMLRTKVLLVRATNRVTHVYIFSCLYGPISTHLITFSPLSLEQ